MVSLCALSGHGAVCKFPTLLLFMQLFTSAEVFPQRLFRKVLLFTTKRDPQHRWDENHVRCES